MITISFKIYTSEDFIFVHDALYFFPFILFLIKPLTGLWLTSI